MQDSGLIISNPKVMMGKPVIRGTRITVELLLEKMAAGQTEEQFLLAHPHITREGVGLKLPLCRQRTHNGTGKTGMREFREHLAILAIRDRVPYIR